MAQYKIKSTLLSAEKSFKTSNDIQQIIHQTLALYDKGEDLSNSPFIQAGEWKHHKDCYNAADPLKCALARQRDIIKVYLNIKNHGYSGSVILVWFDDEGYVHLYDGFHRIAIMSYLGLVDYLNVDTSWIGLDGKIGRDFPLTEVLEREAPGGQWLYQPVEDERVKGWKLARNDSPQRLDYILKNLTGDTVLDIGCSEGYFSREIARRGYKVVAIDNSPGLIAAARYLSILSGVEVDYRVGEWHDILTNSNRFDNILFLSVLHNDMKKIGVEKGLEKLVAFQDRAQRVFFEMPNNNNEQQWMKPGFPNFDFHAGIPMLEQKMAMSARDSFNALRRTYLFEKDGHQVDELDNWINRKGGEHYKPLFGTLKAKPCRNIMETGVFNGDNAVMMIKAAATKVPENEIHYYGFDLFEEKNPRIAGEEFCGGFGKPISEAQARANIEGRTKAKVTLVKGNTRKTLAKAVKNMPEMDLIYIDGGHTIETTRNDWKQASKLVGKDTVVYFDDYDDEMPFMGARFIIDELQPKYAAEVMPEVNYYPRTFGRLKSQLLKVQVKDITIKKSQAVSHYRFHLLGLPHSKTTKDWVLCPFTQLAYKMAQMLTDMGHEVYHYGTEGSNPPCTEQVDVLTKATQKEAYGDWDPNKQLWIHNGNDLAYRTFRQNAIREINLRKEPRDILLVSVGTWQKEIADKTGVLTIEPYVGYLGYFAKYKVFPSYAWMHHMYGKVSTSRKENFACGNWYDAVIPHYFDPRDFEFSDRKDDYFLYVGRFITRKGPHIASQVCEHLGVKLKAAGQLLYPDKQEESLHAVGMDKPHVEYLGTVNREERNKLMAHAKATFVPSIYLEPFGQVAVESLLCGTPVISTDWGAFPEIVRQGEVGYRCHTFDDFIWAAKNIDKLSPERCRDYAVANYSTDVAAKRYNEYFHKVYDLFSEGWYAEHPKRRELDWLRKY